jgi:signal transduction histidine kinase
MEQMIMSALPVRSQKMEALGTIAGGIVHDFNSMLVPIISYGGLAQQRVGEGSPLRRYLDNIMLAASRPRELADRVLSFGRTGLTHRTPFRFNAWWPRRSNLKVSLPPYVRLGNALSASNALVIADPAQLHRIIVFKLDLCSRNDRCEVQL